MIWGHNQVCQQWPHSPWSQRSPFVKLEVSKERSKEDISGGLENQMHDGKYSMGQNKRIKMWKVSFLIHGCSTLCSLPYLWFSGGLAHATEEEQTQWKYDASTTIHHSEIRCSGRSEFKIKSLSLEQPRMLNRILEPVSSFM